MRPSQQVETFPDGVVEVYEEANRTIGALRVRLRFEELSVGVNRYYQAQTSVATNRIDRVIKVPRTNKADRMNIVRNNRRRSAIPYSANTGKAGARRRDLGASVGRGHDQKGVTIWPVVGE